MTHYVSSGTLTPAQLNSTPLCYLTQLFNARSSFLGVSNTASCNCFERLHTLQTSTLHYCQKAQIHQLL